MQKIAKERNVISAREVSSHRMKIYKYEQDQYNQFLHQEYKMQWVPY